MSLHVFFFCADGATGYCSLCRTGYLLSGTVLCRGGVVPPVHSVILALLFVGAANGRPRPLAPFAKELAAKLTEVCPLSFASP